MHADADVPFRADLRFSGVQPHPDLHDRVRRASGRGQVALGVDGCSDRVTGGAERDEERVALRVHDPALVGRERRLEQPPVLTEDLVVVVASELLEQPGRPLEVGEKECDSP